MQKALLLKKISLIAILAALCCAGTCIQIRMPAGDFVHLGNFVMIIAALLLGGVAGGLVGSLGMGIYDLIFYISKPSTVIRTFLLKFLVGFIVGSLFHLIIKKRRSTKPLLIAMMVFCLAIAGIWLTMFFMGDRTGFGPENNFSAIFENIFGSKKSFKVSLFVPGFAIIFAIFNLFALIFNRKLSNRSKAALFAITIAVFVNIVGEFFLRWLLEGLMVSDFNTSLIVATSKIPGSLITGFISVFFAVLVYEPVYRALAHASLIKRVDDEVIE